MCSKVLFKELLKQLYSLSPAFIINRRGKQDTEPNVIELISAQLSLFVSKLIHFPLHQLKA